MYMYISMFTCVYICMYICISTYVYMYTYMYISGGVDKDLYEGPITMFPVVQLHYWSIELVEFKIGDVIPVFVQSLRAFRQAQIEYDMYTYIYIYMAVSRLLRSQEKRKDALPKSAH